MKICIVGAGAIGGLVGVKLILVGNDVTLVDQGARLKAIKTDGLRVIWQDGTELVAEDVKVTDSLADAGKQDMVIIALKAHAIASVAPKMHALFGNDTAVVPMLNGLPWWYFQRHGGPHDGRRLSACDPVGIIAANIDIGRIVGCVVYPAAETLASGIVRHIEGDRFPVGEPDGSPSERVHRVSDVLTKAGFKAPVLDDIRGEIWLKLWGNLAFNPISALTHAALLDICQFPLTRQLAADMMNEAQRIANKLGVSFRVPLDKRIAGAEKVGRHKTSTLQDVEAGRPLEIDALLAAVIELGKVTDTATPHIDGVFALAKLLAKTLEDERSYLTLQKLP